MRRQVIRLLWSIVFNLSAQTIYAQQSCPDTIEEIREAGGGIGNQTHCLDEAKFGDLTGEEIRALTQDQWQHIPGRAFNRFGDMRPIRGRIELRYMRPEQMGWITGDQWRQVRQGQLRRWIRRMSVGWLREVNLASLPEDGLRAIPRRSVPDLTDEQLRQLGPERFFTLTRAQVLALTPHQLRVVAATGGDEFRARLREEQDSHFRALHGLRYGVRLIGGSYAQLSGVVTGANADTEGSTSFGLGIDAEEILWQLRVVVRGGVLPSTLSAAVGSAQFGQSMLNPEVQPLYLGFSSRGNQ